MFALVIFRFLLNIPHVGSKARLLCHIIENPCEHSTGHIFALQVLKIDQNIYFDYFQALFIYKLSCEIKKYVNRSYYSKTFWTLQSPHFWLGGMKMSGYICPNVSCKCKWKCANTACNVCDSCVNTSWPFCCSHTHNWQEKVQYSFHKNIFVFFVSLLVVL